MNEIQNNIYNIKKIIDSNRDISILAVTKTRTLDEINSAINGEKKDILIGRMIQNIKLCKKFKVKTAIASFASSPYGMRSPHDISSFFRILGMEKPEFIKF